MDSSHLVHSLDNKNSAKMATPMFLILVAVAVLIGIGGGFFLAHGKSSNTSSASTSGASQTTSDGTPKSAGIADKTTFKDTAEGVLKEGGIDGEGDYHLVRPGGDSQNVYLTSTAVDLSKFLNKKVKVLGSTMNARHAGWFMDVGYIEVED